MFTRHHTNPLMLQLLLQDDFPNGHIHLGNLWLGSGEYVPLDFHRRYNRSVFYILCIQDHL